MYNDEIILCQLAGIGKVGQGTKFHAGNETEAGEDVEKC
ncbi:uncharacterized protein METZ01_LOCUS439382 [marine metagenome]|uniref:Uncharacterized protein n=1 Tax=marine metagenome TaxID=408172 RepID=A0A382YVH1_9ZZZZ